MGAHYSVLDFLFSSTLYTNCTITLNPGVAIGIYPYNYGYGIALMSGAKLQSLGTAESPVTIAFFKTVQEGSITNQRTTTFSITTSWMSAAVQPQASFNFTKWYAVASQGLHFSDYYEQILPTTFQNCEFFSGGFQYLFSDLGLTNCLFDRVHSFFGDEGSGNTVSLFNCGFYGGSCSLDHFNSNPWVFQDNWFDRCSFDIMESPDTYTYNAYIGVTNYLGATLQSGDISLTNLAWQAGPLGNFYQPSDSPLIDAGSVVAPSVGLYHFTTQTNQYEEVTTTVDCGYHYVAVDDPGKPLDYDGDGIPDYLEDLNGNGLVDSGETDWRNAADLGLKVKITRPTSNSIIP